MPEPTPTLFEDSRPIRLIFRLTTAATAMFILTIFAMVAAMFADPHSPAASFLNDNGGAIIKYEVAAILVLGLLAMTVDRIRTLRLLRSQRRAGRRQPPG